VLHGGSLSRRDRYADLEDIKSDLQSLGGAGCQDEARKGDRVSQALPTGGPKMHGAAGDCLI